MKYLIFAFLLMLPFSAHAETDPAVQTKQAESFISDLGNKAIEVLRDDANNKDVLHSEFKSILNKSQLFVEELLDVIIVICTLEIFEIYL